MGMQKRMVTESEAATRTVAHKLVSRYIPQAADQNKPLVIMLYGNLGAGKTVFVKEMGEVLGINDIVSPAFVVYYEYPLTLDGWKYFYHFDLYRITESSEFDHLGIGDLLVGGNILAVEWSERSGPVRDMIYSKAIVISVQIEHEKGDTRIITITEPEL